MKGQREFCPSFATSLMKLNLFPSTRSRTFLNRRLSPRLEISPVNLRLQSGSRVAVAGSGPAGSFFSYFLLDSAQRIGMDVRVDIYEPRDFSLLGPTGCNMCGGVVSESLVQILATEGINLPSTVVQRGIDSYILHTDVGSVRIETPLHEKRIAAVHRGAGPRNMTETKWTSFDAYLQALAVEQGAHLMRERVDSLSWEDGSLRIGTRCGAHEYYELLAVAVGVNSASLKVLQGSIPGYQPPGTTKTFICEYPLGEGRIREYLGNSMHVFLLNVPRLEFAAVIPKGDYATYVFLAKKSTGHL